MYTSINSWSIRHYMASTDYSPRLWVQSRIDRDYIWVFVWEIKSTAKFKPFALSKFRESGDEGARGGQWEIAMWQEVGSEKSPWHESIRPRTLTYLLLVPAKGTFPSLPPWMCGGAPHHTLWDRVHCTTWSWFLYSTFFFVFLDIAINSYFYSCKSISYITPFKKKTKKRRKKEKEEKKKGYFIKMGHTLDKYD